MSEIVKILYTVLKNIVRSMPILHKIHYCVVDLNQHLTTLGVVKISKFFSIYRFRSKEVVCIPFVIRQFQSPLNILLHDLTLISSLLTHWRESWISLSNLFFIFLFLIWLLLLSCDLRLFHQRLIGLDWLGPLKFDGIGKPNNHVCAFLCIKV